MSRITKVCMTAKNFSNIRFQYPLASFAKSDASTFCKSIICVHPGAESNPPGPDYGRLDPLEHFSNPL